jgi:type III pantothenate kinase
MTTILAVDVGNSRIKWGICKEYQWLAKKQLAYEEIQALLVHWKEFNNISYVVASSVANQTITKQLDAIFTSFNFKVHWIVSRAYQCGIQNNYKFHTQLGSDRWAAMIAAWNKFHDSCVVVNVGTAMTVDTISCDGVFLGGYIVPGPVLQFSSLTERIQFSHASEVAKCETFPTTTSNAIHNGIFVALSALIEKSMQLFYKHQGYHPKNCILSGGGAAFIRAHIEFPVIEIDNLVLDGLIVIAHDLLHSDPC